MSAPLSNVITRAAYAVALRHAGRLDDSKLELRKVLEIDNNSRIALGTLDAICTHQGKFDEAILLTEKAHALTICPDPITGQLAALLARSGHTSRVGQRPARVSRPSDA